MKRLLQGMAVLQLFLVIALAVRIVGVWTTTPPEFGEIPELPATTSLPPPKPAPKVSESLTGAIVEHDLFDEQRGRNKDILLEAAAIDETPVPPPSTVKLMGVMMFGDAPVGILLDTSVKPEQQAVRKGQMFGEYEIGDITQTGLTLLGGAGQQFQIPLRIEAAAGGAAPPPPAAARPGANANAPRPASAARIAAARPVPPHGVGAVAEAPDQEAMSAREHAEAIARRNADMRENGPYGKAPATNGAGKQNGGAADPGHLRLEALRQLRDAATGR